MIPYILLIIFVFIVTIYYIRKFKKNKFINNLKIGDKIGVLCYGIDSETIFTSVIKDIEKDKNNKVQKIHVEYVDNVYDNVIFQEEKYLFPKVFTPDLVYPPISR